MKTTLIALAASGLFASGIAVACDYHDHKDAAIDAAPMASTAPPAFLASDAKPSDAAPAVKKAKTKSTSKKPDPSVQPLVVSTRN